MKPAPRPAHSSSTSAARSFVQPHGDGVYLRIKLLPRASKDEIGEALGDELKIKVTAPPVDAAANEALLRLLAERLQCPRRCTQLVRGQTSRHKVVFVQGMNVESVLVRLC